MKIKMTKNDSFLVFPADESKELVTVWAKYLSAPERSCQQKKYQNSVSSKVDTLLMVAQNATNT